MKKHLLFLLLYTALTTASEDITPYKIQSYDDLFCSTYTIPASSRFEAHRSAPHAPPIIYYQTVPKNTVYPFAILCTGSSHRNSISSVIHVHRYFLEELLNLNVGVITVEQWGVDGNNIDADAFMAHYTRSQRLYDHFDMIQHLRKNPPQGWNGKVIFIGVSEGGPLVTTLTEIFQADTLATINWCGAGDHNWREELWTFFDEMKKNSPWYWKIILSLPFILPQNRSAYDKIMNAALRDRCLDKEFGGMTYLYHADAMSYPTCRYNKIKTPFLVVIGTLDPILPSSDLFVEKATEAGVPITYFRIDGMDHYVRKRPDIIEQSFNWLKNNI